MNDIILYTIGCPACMVLEKKLNSHGISFRKVEDEKEFDRLGIVDFPVLSVDGYLMNFGEAVKAINGYSKGLELQKVFDVGKEKE